MKFLASAKSKVLAGVAAVSALSSNALAADGTVTGDLNVGPFMSIAGAVLVAYGVFFAVKKGLGLLK